MPATRILIVGGGYVGMYTALGLQKKLSRGSAEITVVEPQSNMTYQPFLPEAAAGSVEPRHVVVSLRRGHEGDPLGQDRDHPAQRGRRVRVRVRRAHRLSRLGVTAAADPGPGRA